MDDVCLLISLMFVNTLLWIFMKFGVGNCNWFT